MGKLLLPRIPTKLCQKMNWRYVLPMSVRKSQKYRRAAMAIDLDRPRRNLAIAVCARPRPARVPGAPPRVRGRPPACRPAAAGPATDLPNVLDFVILIKKIILKNHTNMYAKICWGLRGSPYLQYSTYGSCIVLIDGLQPSHSQWPPVQQDSLCGNDLRASSAQACDLDPWSSKYWRIHGRGPSIGYGSKGELRTDTPVAAASLNVNDKTGRKI